MPAVIKLKNTNIIAQSSLGLLLRVNEMKQGGTLAVSARFMNIHNQKPTSTKGNRNARAEATEFIR
jgi:hypothetical protein